MPGGAVGVGRGRRTERHAGDIGIRCDPKLDVGTIGVRDGAITWAADIDRMGLPGQGQRRPRPRPERTVDLAGARVAPGPRGTVAGGEFAGGEVLMVFGSAATGEAANVNPRPRRAAEAVSEPPTLPSGHKERSSCASPSTRS